MCSLLTAALPAWTGRRFRLVIFLRIGGPLLTGGPLVLQNDSIAASVVPDSNLIASINIIIWK
jgi:hypothetical protein